MPNQITPLPHSGGGKERGALVAYAEVAPGRCYHCKGKLARVSAGPNRGKFAFVAITDEIGNGVVAHVSCNDSHEPRLTAREPEGDDFYVVADYRGWSGRLTDKKPGAE